MPPRHLSAPLLSWSSCSASCRALPHVPPPAAAAHWPCWLGQAALCQGRWGRCDRAGVACGAESGVLGLSPPGAGRGRSQAIATYEKERRCDGGGLGLYGLKVGDVSWEKRWAAGCAVCGLEVRHALPVPAVHGLRQQVYVVRARVWPLHCCRRQHPGFSLGALVGSRADDYLWCRAGTISDSRPVG